MFTNSPKSQFRFVVYKYRGKYLRGGNTLQKYAGDTIENRVQHYYISASEFVKIDFKYRELSASK